MRRSTHTPRHIQLERLRLQGWQVVSFKGCSAVVAWHEIAGKHHAKAWRAKRDATEWYHTFRSMASLESFARAFAETVASAESRAAERTKERAAKRATLRASDHWAVGDVIYNSWGYDQTNIDWYQVTEVLARSIRVRSIAGATNMGATMSGTTQPRRNEFAGEPMLKPLDERGQITFEHGAACKWDGRAKSCSCYA